MLRCEYCGKQNLLESASCADCGRALEAPKAPATKGERPNLEAETDGVLPTFDGINLDQIPGAFSFEAGFSRPNWDLLWERVERTVAPIDHADAWQQVLWQWAHQLSRDLGGNYRVHSSDDFLLLSDTPRDSAARILDFAENVVTIARESLGDLAWRDDWGKQVILMFSDDDDYFQYTSWFYEADKMPNTSGLHISKGVPHTVVRAGTAEGNSMVVAHELVHSCLQHLPIPAWVNEGVAQRLERAIARVVGSDVLMSHEVAERHHAFWNEENIQAFWAGTLFHSSDDAQELSYSLAEVLVHLLSEDRESFLNFLSQATYEDGGQTAALDCLGTSLGDVVAGFLGEGNWRPIRKHLVACWEQQNRSTRSPEEEPPEQSREA